MATSTESPCPWAGNLIGFQGIVVDIFKYLYEFPQPGNDPGKESGTPHMACYIPDTVISHGEHTQDPAHDRGKTFAPRGLDDEMEMVAHDAKVVDPESVFEFGALDDR